MYGMLVLLKFGMEIVKQSFYLREIHIVLAKNLISQGLFPLSKASLIIYYCDLNIKNYISYQ